MAYIKLGIFGATGAVGRELIQVLFDKRFPIGSLRLFASPKSKGRKIKTPAGDIEIEDCDKADFSELDLAFFAVSGEWSKKYAKKANKAGCIVIDNSSAFRYDDDTPLIVPQINADAISDSKLISNPNCTTAIAALPLYALHQRYGLKKVLISTYQAASGAGSNGMDELITQTKDYLEGKEMKTEVFQYPLAFNIIPHIDQVQDNSYTREEMKVVWETRKIFGDQDINICCTCVRVPTLRVHAESIVVETKRPINVEEAKDIFSNTPGILLKDNPLENIYPMPITATGKYDVEVGRIRQSLIFGCYGLEFFVAGDQLLRGAALNAVEVAESLLNRWEK